MINKPITVFNNQSKSPKLGILANYSANKHYVRFFSLIVI